MTATSASFPSPPRGLSERKCVRKLTLPTRSLAASRGLILTAFTSAAQATRRTGTSVAAASPVRRRR